MAVIGRAGLQQGLASAFQLGREAASGTGDLGQNLANRHGSTLARVRRPEGVPSTNTITERPQYCLRQLVGILLFTLVEAQRFLKQDYLTLVCTPQQPARNNFYAGAASRTPTPWTDKPATGARLSSFAEHPSSRTPADAPADHDRRIPCCNACPDGSAGGENARIALNLAQSLTGTFQRILALSTRWFSQSSSFMVNTLHLKPLGRSVKIHCFARLRRPAASYPPRPYNPSI